MSLSDEFVYETMAEISELFDIAKQLYYANDTQFNSTMQNQIYLLGKEKGFISEYNYMVGNNVYEKKNEIDVIWRTNNNAIAAFIVNKRFNRSTVEYLSSVNAFFKFWIYYGESEIPFVKRIVNDLKIHVIKKKR